MNKPILLTLKKAQEMVQAAIDERGSEYVYERPSALSDCLYVHDAGTDGAHAGCGIGLAFALGGLPLETLRLHEHNDATELINKLVDSGVVVLADVRASAFMQEFQAAQDAGFSWGEAMERAMDRV